MIRHIVRNLPSLESRFIHEGQIPGAFQSEKLREPFPKTDGARRGIHSALHFAPIADLRA
jgi:hypothetical protein